MHGEAFNLLGPHMGSITLAAVTAVLLQAADPPGAFHRWGAEFGLSGAYDSYAQANALTVTSPLWLLEVRVRSPWGLSLGLLGMSASGTEDAGGYGNSISRKMLGFDLEYALPFSTGALDFGRAWIGVGLAAGSTSYAHVDEPYNSQGHMREFRFMGGIDFLIAGFLALGPWVGTAFGDTTATVYWVLGQAAPAAPSRAHVREERGEECARCPPLGAITGMPG
jgi:hypothetical protein